MAPRGVSYFSGSDKSRIARLVARERILRVAVAVLAESYGRGRAPAWTPDLVRSMVRELRSAEPEVPVAFLDSGLRVPEEIVGIQIGGVDHLRLSMRVLQDGETIASGVEELHLWLSGRTEFLPRGFPRSP
jgi:hypothetical protein